MVPASAGQLSLTDLAASADELPDLRSTPEPRVTGLLTAAEVAQVLRVPRSSVYELACSRRIPFLNLNRVASLAVSRRSAGPPDQMTLRVRKEDPLN